MSTSNEEGFGDGFSDGTISEIANDVEAWYAIGLLSVGLFIIALQVLFNVGGDRVLLASTTIMLFSIIEIPRLRRFDVNVKLVAVSFTALHAIGLIALLAEGVVRYAAPISLILLFLSTLLVSYMQEVVAPEGENEVDI